MLLLMEGELDIETWFGPGTEHRLPGITYQARFVSVVLYCFPIYSNSCVRLASCSLLSADNFQDVVEGDVVGSAPREIERTFTQGRSSC